MARVSAEKIEEAKARAQAKTKTTEQLVQLDNCTLSSFKLMSNGLGFDIHFTAPLSEAGKLEALTVALQKLVAVNVTRTRRGAPT